MTEHDAHLAQVLAAPAADLPRLVYADWLDEHADDPCPGCDGRGEVRFCDAAGDMDDEPCRECGGSLAGGYRRGAGKAVGRRKRAEFIRVQVELAEIAPHCETSLACSGCSCPMCRRYEPLKRREQELLEQHEVDWLTGWPLWEVGFQVNSTWVPDAEWVFRRGFVDEIRLRQGPFQKHASELSRRHPITRVVLVGRQPYASPRYGDDIPGPMLTPDRFNFGWCDNPSLVPDTSNIGPAIWPLLPADGTVDLTRHFRFYRTRRAALDALSAAAVLFGRQRAGLPTLEPEPAT